MGLADASHSQLLPPAGVGPVSLPPAPVDAKPGQGAPPGAAVLPAAINGLFDGPWYYPARYLHRRVTVLQPIEPKVPTAAGDMRGKVALVLRVSRSGTVDGYDILESEPPGFFEQSVIDAFASERYAPGLIAGTPVRGLLHVEVLFEPGEAPKAVIDFNAFR